MTDRADDLDRFYGLLSRLGRAVGGVRTLGGCDGRLGWPLRGVYFFFEPGETRRDGMPRVTRVGTHALTTTSQSSLWGRLAQHRGTVGGRHGGGGNHRGSIFRRHVGAALLARDGDPSATAAATWGTGSSAGRETVAAEYAHELAVSAYLRALPFLWLAVDDPAGRTSHRGVIERGSIGLLSGRVNPLADRPSPGWLGLHAAAEIRTSGLWNVNHVDERYDPAVLDGLQFYVVELERSAR
jgi:hypothetical protein